MISHHKHHILPKHMGGSNDPDNLVLVTVETHANLHKQLWEDLGYEEDRIAWLALSKQISLSEAQILSWELGVKKSAEVNASRIWTEEQKQKLRGPRPNFVPHHKNKKLGPRTEETKEKIKQTLLGKKHSEARIEANRQGQLKRFTDPIEKEKISKQLENARSKRKYKKL